ncbi:MAG: hypothetical protein RR749_20090 [Comamonas sp.]
MGIDRCPGLFDSHVYRLLQHSDKEMSYGRGFIVVLCMLGGWTWAHAVESAAPSRVLGPDGSMVETTAPQRAASERRDRPFALQGASLAQGLLDRQGSTGASQQDDETVFHLVRQGVGVLTDQVNGSLQRPAPKLGGLLLVLLAVFATVLGILSLRWHRETAE